MPAPKHLHPSLDLISLLHLDGLYNTYVRPYADLHGEDEEDEVPGQKVGRAKKRRIEKGYQHLLEDCIGKGIPSPSSVSQADKRGYSVDPMPLGERRDHLSLLPLTTPQGLWEKAIDVLPLEAFGSARLNPGIQQEGVRPSEFPLYILIHADDHLAVRSRGEEGCPRGGGKAPGPSSSVLRTV